MGNDVSTLGHLTPVVHHKAPKVKAPKVKASVKPKKPKIAEDDNTAFVNAMMSAPQAEEPEPHRSHRSHSQHVAKPKQPKAVARKVVKKVVKQQAPRIRSPPKLPTKAEVEARKKHEDEEDAAPMNFNDPTTWVLASVAVLHRQSKHQVSWPA